MTEHVIQICEAPKILEDVFEAIIGALYLDGGLAVAVEVMKPFLAPVVLFTAKYSKQMSLDPKDDFFTHIQRANKQPHFRTERVPKGDKMDTSDLMSLREASIELIKCEIVFDGEVQATGVAYNREQAEKNAAIAAMRQFFPS